MLVCSGRKFNTQGLAHVSHVSSVNYNEFNQEFEVSHYQRPLSDYFNTLVEVGFRVNEMVEPELTRELLKNNPRFKEYKDHPIGLIFCCSK